MILQKILFYLKRNKNVKLEYSNSEDNDIEVELLHKSPIYELSQTISNINSNDNKRILKSNILVFKVKVGNRNLFSNFIFDTLTELINNHLCIVKKSNTEFIIYGNYISFNNLFQKRDTEDIVFYNLSKVFNININPTYYNMDIKKSNDILNYISDILSYHIYVIDHYCIDIDNNYICFATDNKDIIKAIKESNYYNYTIPIEESCYIVNISEKDLFNIIRKNYMIDNNISSTIPSKLHIVIKELLKNINIAIYDTSSISFEDIDEEDNSQYYKDIDEIIE